MDKIWIWIFNCLPDFYYLRAVKNLLLLAGGVHLSPAAVFVRRPFYCDHPKNIRIGKGAFINGGLLIEGEGQVTLGSQVNLGPRVTITTTNHWATKIETKAVLVAEGVWIGAASTLTPGTKIEAGAVLAAGSVVSGDVKGRQLWGGVPAKFIREL